MEKGLPKTPVKFWSRSNGGSKVMARSNRYSCLARPDLVLTEYGFHIHYIEKGIHKLVKFWSRSNDRIKSYGPFEPLILRGATRPPPHQVWIPHPLNGKRASGNSRKILVTIQRLDQKLWPVRTVTLAWSNQTSSSTSIDSTSTIWKRASKKSRKILITIQRSDQKLWPLRTDTLALHDQISSSPSIDSTSTIWKRASKNSGKILIAIQRSDQKLWPVRTVTLAWRDQISSSPSIVSTSTIWKRVSGNTCKNFITIQRLVQTLWPFEPLLLPQATKPPHRVLIPHPL